VLLPAELAAPDDLVPSQRTAFALAAGGLVLAALEPASVAAPAASTATTAAIRIE
jgi:uncharacterized membrane protein YidH (DUF202 family)